MAAKCTSPNSLDHGLQAHLQTPSITASKCISKLAWLQPPSSHDHGLHVHLETGSSTAAKFPRSWPPCASPKSLTERTKRVRDYKAVPSHDEPLRLRGIHEHLARVREEPHKLHGSMNAWQGCVGPRAEKERVCISYNAMMSIYPVVSQKHPPCRWVHLCMYIYKET